MSMNAVAEAPPRPPRRDASATRQSILDAALVEFSENGLSGARVDAIAARTGTNVRMIYYYFGSKVGLYRTVLEQCYAAMRTTEAGLDLACLPPADAIQRLVEFTFDYQEANPRFVRMVAIENIHRGEHIAQSTTIQPLNNSVVATIEAVLGRGKAGGVFRDDAEAIAVHLLMTSFCFFRVANRHTLTSVFRQDPLSPALRTAHRRMLVESVLGYLRR